MTSKSPTRVSLIVRLHGRTRPQVARHDRCSRHDSDGEHGLDVEVLFDQSTRRGDDNVVLGGRVLRQENGGLAWCFARALRDHPGRLRDGDVIVEFGVQLAGARIVVCVVYWWHDIDRARYT